MFVRSAKLELMFMSQRANDFWTVYPAFKKKMLIQKLIIRPILFSFMINDNTSILHPTHYYYKSIQHLYKWNLRTRYATFTNVNSKHIEKLITNLEHGLKKNLTNISLIGIDRTFFYNLFIIFINIQIFIKSMEY